MVQFNGTTVTNSSGTPRVAEMMINLWQAYGGTYGQYFAWINSASIAVLALLRILNWAPWLQEPAHSFLWSTRKTDLYALALWQTGKLETHHQYLATFFLFCSCSRFGGSWQCSPEIQTLWYGPFVRLLSRASNYTLLFAMFFQYDKISWPYTTAGLLALIVSRTYEVFYPWLDVRRPTSPLRQSEQMKMAMTKLDKEASRCLLTSPIMPWSHTFHNVTHSRLVTFRMQLKSFGLLLPLSVLNVLKGNPSLLESRHGWVEGSGIVTVGSLLVLVFGIVEVALAEDTPLLLKVGLGSLFFQCFLCILLLSVPPLAFSLGKAAQALAIHPSNDDVEEEAHHQERHELWWVETKEFLKSLLTIGFPFEYHRTSFSESILSSYFWYFLGLLEGIELALYVCLAAGIKFALRFSLHGMILLIKSTRLGGGLSLLCLKFRSMLIKHIVVRIPLPGLSSIAMDLLNAEITLASQKVCPRGHCITTIRLDEILRVLEEIVVEKGQVEEAHGAFFVHPHASEDRLELPEEEELKHQAIALGLMQSATSAVQKLMTTLHVKKEGASALHSLLQFLRVYSMESTVSNEETKISMIAVANIVQEVLTESISHHWDCYQKQDHLEANYCGCISDTEWIIMVAQLHVSMLLVYVGWRSSSMCWPYGLSESESMKNWANARLSDVNIAAGATECSFLFL